MSLGKNELPSNRTFGLFMAGAAGALALLLSFSDRLLGAALAALLATLTAFAAWLKPDLLAPFNQAWALLGAAINRIVSPIVLAILFFALFTPLALLLRAFGRDELRLRGAPGKATYWRLREPPGPEPASFRRQF
jgi:hypothetical protein